MARSAGPRRNREMLFKGEPDFIIAFLDSLSMTNGTDGMIELGETYGKRIIVCKKACWSEKCETCGEPYSEPSTERAMICSSGFHCCRDCTRESGKVVSNCERHKHEEV